MATPPTITKYYNNFHGLNLRDSDIVRLPTHASDGTSDVVIDSSGNLMPRTGIKWVAPSESTNPARLGLFEFSRKTPLLYNGAPYIETEYLYCSENLFRSRKGTLSITYTNAGGYNSLTAVMSPATGFALYADGGSTPIYSNNSPYDLIADIDTDISALPNFTATHTTSSTGTEFIANLPVTEVEVVKSGGVINITIDYLYWEGVPFSGTAPFTNLNTNYTTLLSDAINNWRGPRPRVSATQLNNCIYFSTGYDDVVKYDGVTVYKAGLPAPTVAATTAEGAAGNVTDTGLQYKYSYIFIDAHGNRIESVISTASVALNPVLKKINVTIPTIVLASGYESGFAKVNGNQAGVTNITVEAGHTINEGVTVYLWDNAVSAYVERYVTGTAATTITVDSAVSVLDYTGAAGVLNDKGLISANLRIGIYRNTAAGSLFYLVEEVPNYPDAATALYVDNTATVTGNAFYIDPTPGTEHYPPPRGRYITTRQGQLIITGNIDYPSDVYFSEVTDPTSGLSPEYFPLDYYFQVGDDDTGEPNTGAISVGESLFIFKKHSTFLVYGDLVSANFRVSTISKTIGCVSHFMACEIPGLPIAICSNVGVFALGPNGLTELSGVIYPLFEEIAKKDHLLDLGVMVYDPTNRYLILNYPYTDNQADYENGCIIADLKLPMFQNSLEWFPFRLPYPFYAAVSSFNGTYYLTWPPTATPSPELHRFNHPTEFGSYLGMRAYYDDIFAITDCNELEPYWYSGWETAGEHTIPKKFLRLQAESPTTVDTGRDSYGFTCSLTTHKDYGTTTHTGTSLTFPALEDLDKVKLKHDKCRALQYIFSQEIAGDPFIISGWSVEIAPTIRPTIREVGQ